MTDEIDNKEKIEGEVIPPEKDDGDHANSEEKDTVVAPNYAHLLEALGPITEGWFENQEKQRDHQLRMAQEQNSHNEKVLDAHKTVFSWQFWTVAAFLGAILFSGLYMLMSSEGNSDQGMLIVSHFAFGIFGVIAGFGIKSASKN